MNPNEVRLRMATMRAQIKNANVYRWAGTLLSELCDIAPKTLDRTPREYSGPIAVASDTDFAQSRTG